jgi:signal transduction histidine kinase
MSLFWKMFASIGVAMVVTLVATVYVSYELASSTLNQVNIEGRDPVIAEAAQVLSQGGERGLREWLRDHTRESPQEMVLLIVDENGRELLGRAMPGEVRRLLEGGSRRGRPGGPGGGGGGANNMGGFGNNMGGFGGGPQPSNFRPAQLVPDLIAPDGEAYRLIFTRPLFTVFGVLTWPGTRFAVAAIAILVAAITSLLLARYISSPIVRLQRASRSLAAGMLETRVGGPAYRRSDEVGILARDFDTMAERIQALVMDKETLLRDVSHELRSPLARMRMALALAQRKATDETQPGLERIEKEAEQLDELIGQIMRLARLRTQEEPQREQLDLTELVNEIVEDLRYEHPQAKINYNVTSALDIRADRRGLKSAIENVVRNAVSYAGTDHPIVIAASRDDKDIVLAVSDRGPGVSDEDLSRIFEPLFRADKSRDHKAGGQGIGLAITSRVMELHGGKVSAENRTGGGLEITLRFPADA